MNEQAKTPAVKDDDILALLNLNLYALAGYLAGFLALIRAPSSKSRPR